MPRGRIRTHSCRKTYLRERQQAIRAAGGEELRAAEAAAQKARRAADPEKAREISNRSKAKARREKPELHTAQWLWWAFRMRPTQYEQMLNEQGGVCKICLGNNSGKKLVVDHDHNKPKGEGNRWLLCNQCNVMLGAAHEHPERLRRAADLLESLS